jgi:hypothetical protein
MAVFMGAFPVLPGKEDEARKFAQETLDRRDEFEESERRVGITKEEWALQQTPMGSMVVVRFETDDVAGAFAGLAESNETFDSGSSSARKRSVALISASRCQARYRRSSSTGRANALSGRLGGTLGETISLERVAPVVAVLDL